MNNRPLVVVAVLALAVWGILVAPFDWNLSWLPRAPIPVDAIPDIGEIQQIVFTEWPGRSPQDVEDQITYPLTTTLLGVPKVKEVRALSMFGFSSIYVIFEDDADFYWSRTRVLEKLNSLPPNTLPQDVQPTLGPDATTLGQVFWYTLEGVDEAGNPTGGWDLHELRTIQDWQVRYFLLAAQGVSEVASIGGFVQEYQIDVNPSAMRANGVSLADVAKAVKDSNLDVGARTIEINQVEYVVRGIGFIKEPADLEKAVVKVRDNVPIRLSDIAHISLGPALRRGALDAGGVEAVGGVVVARYGDNPLKVIKNVKQKIAELQVALPSKTLPDGTVSQVRLVPFYDRTGLIFETLNTLNTALILETLVTIIVVLVIMNHLSSSLLISGSLPLVVLMVFILMKTFGIDANVVSLAGIAIAIGTIVTMGIIVCENIQRHLHLGAGLGKRQLSKLVVDAVGQVGSSVLTAIATTVISFLPVFAMQGEEGRLFRPLAFTKTFALLASLVVGLYLIPPLVVAFSRKARIRNYSRLASALVLAIVGIALGIGYTWWGGVLVILIAGYIGVRPFLPRALVEWTTLSSSWMLALIAAIILALQWLPLGPEQGSWANIAFTSGLLALLLLIVYGFQKVYPHCLRWVLNHKLIFMSLPLAFVIAGLFSWLGFATLFQWLPNAVLESPPAKSIANTFPGLGREFMPPLDEGSFLFMPAAMPHASIGEAMEILREQDLAIQSIPEVDLVVGKLGRVESPLDPAPISMFETVINYRTKYLTDSKGRPLRFEYNSSETDYFRTKEGAPVAAPDGRPYIVQGKFSRDEEGRLIPDAWGSYFPQWRPALVPDLNSEREPWPGTRNTDDIWDDILTVTAMPGVTVPAKLQPIATRLIMLQSGLRAPLGVIVQGPDLPTLETASLAIEAALKTSPGVESSTVIADRVIGKPYLEINIDRTKIARYGLNIQDVQDMIETAIGGKLLTRTVEGRERYPVRMRYLRELRSDVESIGEILITVSPDQQIPLIELATIDYVRGPQIIKSENGFLTTYVTFDRQSGWAEVDVAEAAENLLQTQIDAGTLQLPPGITYSFTGSFESQQRATKTMSIILPASLVAIFVILYLQFKSFTVSVFVFSGIIVAWTGGFIILWLYNQSWFMDVALFGLNMRDLFQVHPINLSVAVWVGFLALFGIATDNGVLIATTIDRAYPKGVQQTVDQIRATTLEASLLRLRPCLMALSVTVLALLPILTAQGRGADLMLPMALPSFGGMIVSAISLFLVPALLCARQERQAQRKNPTP